MLELFNYLSTWIQVFHTVWFIMYKFNFKVAKYLNPYYLNIILLAGYILFMYTELIVKKEEYELSFYIVNSILHILPLLIMCTLRMRKKYSMFTTILLISVYLLYITLKEKRFCDIYLIDTTYKSWKDLKKLF